MWLQQGGESLVSSERGQVFAVAAAALSGNLQCQANTCFASLVVCARLEVGAMAGSRLCQVLAKKKDPSHCCPLLCEAVPWRAPRNSRTRNVFRLPLFISRAS